MERSSILSRGRSWLALEISADGFELPRAHSPAMSATSLASVTTASRVVPARRCASDVGASSRLAPPRRGASVASRAAVATAPATAGVDKAAARELVAWLTVEKGLPADAASQVSFGDGGAATLVSDARAGEPLIEIPQNLAVTSVDVADSPIVSGLAAGRGELVGLALWLCHERAKGALSDWAPYIATLPGAGADHPLLWPEAEMNDLLQGSPAREEALSRAASAAEEYASIRASIDADPTNYPADAYAFLTREAFLDALATVLARAVWLNAANCYAMVPLVDLLPIVGAPPPGVSPAVAAGGPAAGKSGLAASAGVVDYDAATECVAVTSANDAQQTAKVVMVDPLARNSGDLFLATGAVDEDHCGDYLTMTASTVETDRLYSAKKQILEGMGMSADEQVASGVCGSHAVATARVHALLARAGTQRTDDGVVRGGSHRVTDERVRSAAAADGGREGDAGGVRELVGGVRAAATQGEGTLCASADGGETAPGGEAAHQRHHHRGASPTGAHPRDSHQAGHGRSQR